MADFHAINDPKYQDLIKHNHRYLIIDDWENVLVAEYDNIIDSFNVILESDDAEQVMRFIFNEGHYIADTHCRIFTNYNGNKLANDTNVNPLAGNRVLKFMPFKLNTDGVKL